MRNVTDLCLLSLGFLLTLMHGCGEVRVPDPAVRFVAFGDSSTKGPAQRDYPDILRELIDAQPEAFANEGHGGESAREGLQRLKDLLARRLYPNAHTLLYWQGGIDILDFIRRTDPLVALSPTSPDYPFQEALNEALEATQANIEAAIMAAREAGWTVYVATYYLPPEAVLPCEPLVVDVILPEQAARAGAYIRLLNERIRRAADNAGATLVDVERSASSLSADVLNFHNCNHLSARGNTAVAEVFRAALQGSATQPGEPG
jgi:lysophospholipase L1-like esterase